MANPTETINALISTADTPEKQQLVRLKVTELFRASNSLEEFAETLGLKVRIVKKGRQQVKELIVDESLKTRMPELIEKKWKELKEREAEEEVSKALPEGIEFKKLDQTFLPPDDQEIATEGVEEEMKAPRLFPRTRLAIETLEQMQVNLEKCIFLEGANLRNMKRGISYRAIVIPKINRSILVCDEEGNRTFVIYQSTNIQQFYKLKKSDLKKLIEQGLIADLTWCESDKWQIKLIELLNKKSDIRKIKKTSSKTSKSQIKTKPTSIEKTPEGWMSNRGLAKQLERNQKLVKKTAEGFREGHPNWFLEYKQKLGPPYEHYHPDICEAIKLEIEKIEEAPEGWMTNNGLAKKLGIAPHSCEKIANKFCDENPEWFKQCKPKRGKVGEYYAPELCERIRNEVNKHEKAPEGWMTNRRLAIELKIYEKACKKIASGVCEEHPEWFKDYKDTVRKLREHYSPELCEKIRNEVNKHEKASEGWMTNRGLSRKLRVAEKTTTNFIDPYRKTKPEWFKQRKPKRGKMREHYSPELCERIQEEVNKYEKASEGWMTNNGLAKRLRIAFGTCQEIASGFHGKYPEWLKDYKDTVGKVSEHYAPELCERIQEEVNKYEKASEGWMTNNGLAKRLRIAFGTCQEIASGFRKEHPEWFKQFKSRIGKVGEHYAPELCEKIWKEVNKHEKAPEGWMTNSGLSRKLRVAEITTANFIEPYRKTKPEWFSRYRDVSNQLKEHYSPELCLAILEKLTE